MATVKINGMKCGHCSGAVTKALESIGGITDVKVDLEKGEAHFDGNISKKTLKEVIEKIEFEFI